MPLYANFYVLCHSKLRKVKSFHRFTHNSHIALFFPRSSSVVQPIFPCPLRFSKPNCAFRSSHGNILYYLLLLPRTTISPFHSIGYNIVFLSRVLIRKSSKGSVFIYIVVLSFLSFARCSSRIQPHLTKSRSHLTATLQKKSARTILIYSSYFVSYSFSFSVVKQKRNTLCARPTLPSIPRSPFLFYRFVLCFYITL